MPNTVDMSASLQTCNATKSTPRHEASSNAIAVANSDAREPSIPTSTGNCADCSDDGASSWITATGQWAWWINPVLTDPSKRRCRPVRPRHPTTTIWASLDKSTSVETGDPKNSSLLISGRSLPSALSLATLVASAMTLRAAFSSISRTSSGTRPAGHVSVDAATAKEGATCTTVSGTWRIVASRAAHRTATCDDGDPSTATTTP